MVQKLFAFLLANDSAHLTDGLHTANQILLHGHDQIPPKMSLVLGQGLRFVDRPLMLQKLFAGLFTDNGAHLADGLHTADQVLLHHSKIPPVLSCCFLSIYRPA